MYWRMGNWKKKRLLHFLQQPLSMELSREKYRSIKWLFTTLT